MSEQKIVEKKKGPRKLKDPRFNGIIILDQDKLTTKRKEYFKHDFIIETVTQILNREKKVKLFRRLFEIRSKLKLATKIIPDFAQGTALEDYVAEIRAIKKLLSWKKVDRTMHYDRKFPQVNCAVKNNKLSSKLDAMESIKYIVKKKRSNLKRVESNIKKWKDYNLEYFHNSTVHRQPGTIRELFLTKRTKDIYNEKLPTKDIKYIGLEFEFCAKIKEKELGLKLVEAGFSQLAQIKHDGSLRPYEGENGFEIALLLPETEFRPHLLRLCTLLKSIDAQTMDRRCGLHVHFDMRKRNKELVFNNLVCCQNILWNLIPNERRDSEFCKSVTSRKFPTFFTGQRSERYKSINAAAYYKYKTLEIRMHEGSVEFYDIYNWLKVLIRIVNSKIKMKNYVNTLTNFQKKFKINKNVMTYMQDRTNKWILSGTRREESGQRVYIDYSTTTAGVAVNPRDEARERLSQADVLLRSRDPAGTSSDVTISRAHFLQYNSLTTAAYADTNMQQEENEDV